MLYAIVLSRENCHGGALLVFTAKFHFGVRPNRPNFFSLMHS